MTKKEIKCRYGETCDNEAVRVIQVGGKKPVCFECLRVHTTICCAMTSVGENGITEKDMFEILAVEEASLKEIRDDMLSIISKAYKMTCHEVKTMIDELIKKDDSIELLDELFEPEQQDS